MRHLVVADSQAGNISDRDLPRNTIGKTAFHFCAGKGKPKFFCALQIESRHKGSGIDEKTTGLTINGSRDGEGAADLLAQRHLDKMLRFGKARDVQTFGRTCLEENPFCIAVNYCFVVGEDVGTNNTILILPVQARIGGSI